MKDKYKVLIELFLIAIVVFAMDHISKRIVFDFLKERREETFILIPGIIGLEKTTNTGGFWGIFKGSNKIIMYINLTVFPFLFVIFYKFIFVSSVTRWGLSFVIGGALGNILDRMLYGYVRDFISIQFIHWPIFNLADTFISIGAFIIVVYVWKSKE